jgi:glutamate-1-semialdehyde 2,1-aminomutase
MAAGIATFRQLEDPAVWAQFDRLGQRLEAGVNDLLNSKGAGACLQRVGAMFTLFFTPHPVTNWASASAADRDRYGRFFRAMLAQGVYLAPSQFEAGFLSTAHGEEEVERTLEAMERALA